MTEEGQTLSIDTSSLSDLDGIRTFTFQWLRNGSFITGATGTDYTLTQDDVGAAITASVRYTDNQGTAESLTSAATHPVANMNDAPVRNIHINGAADIGETLSVGGANAVTDVDGLGVFSYQWLRGGVEIVGASAPIFTLTGADLDAVNHRHPFLYRCTGHG